MNEPSVWDYRDNLDYDLPLDPGDPRLVPLNDARGDFSERRILKALGVDPIRCEVRKPPERQYVLFGGHRGCGKSTELRRLAKILEGPDRYFVVFIDALTELDVHNSFWWKSHPVVRTLTGYREALATLQADG